jgi:hypothetical protein
MPRPRVSEDVRCAEQRDDDDGDSEASARADVGEGVRWRTIRKPGAKKSPRNQKTI